MRRSQTRNQQRQRWITSCSTGLRQRRAHAQRNGRVYRMNVSVRLGVVMARAAVVLSIISCSAMAGAQTRIVGDTGRSIPPGPVPGTLLPTSYVRAVGQIAFIWRWPLVNMHNRHLVFSKVPENGLGDGILPVGPLNRLTMLTEY